MQMWILKPPGFDPAKKWPVAFLVHGGPQSAWEDGWSNRWNPSLWAAQGYVVALPNPRGSTGNGQKFVGATTLYLGYAGGPGSPIPAPGAVALLAAAGLIGSTRRR